MPLSSLVELIPSRAVYRRVALDPRRNALGPWREAAEKFVRPDDENPLWAQLAFAAPLSAMRISSPQQTLACEILGRNAASLELLDQGLERGKLQFGEFQSLEEVSADTEFAARLGDVARLHLIGFRLRFAEEDLAAAAEELFRLEKIGAMICGGEGQMVHYLIGLWLRAAALRGFGQLAARQQTPRDVLQRILAALDEGLKVPDGLAQSLRVDLCTLALARLDRTAEGPDVEEVVDKLLEVYYVPHVNATVKAGGPQHAAIADGWLEERRRQMLLLLDGHPKPLDKAATARLMGAAVAQTIRDLSRCCWPAFLDVIGQLHGLRRKMRLHRLTRKTRFWPAELVPGGSAETPPGIDAATSADGSVTTVQLAAENLADARLADLKAKARRVENPVGLVLARHVMAYDYSPHLLGHLRTMRTMRGLIKQRLSREHKGQGATEE